MEGKFFADERREFLRLDYVTPLGYKICKKETLDKLLQGYTTNISEAGLLCNLKDKVELDDVMWLSFDRGTLSICSGLESKVLIYQNGIIGKVVRLELSADGNYLAGIKFLTRQEHDISSFIPRADPVEKEL